jgi:hypothetical protein
MLRILLLIMLLAATPSSRGMTEAQQAQIPDEQQPQADQPIELALGNVKPLNAVIRIAEMNRIPLGIVFGTGALLCSGERPTSIHAKNFAEALTQAVAGTGYTAIRNGEAYVLLAPDATAHEQEILNYRFDRFSATDSTMNDAGQLLAGYIKTKIEGAQGFITSSPVGPLSTTFTIRMQGATTKEIANRIVSQKDKGVWMLRPTPQSASKSTSQSHLRIFAYSEDAAELDRVSCGVDPSESM